MTEIDAALLMLWAATPVGTFWEMLLFKVIAAGTKNHLKIPLIALPLFFLGPF